MNVARLGKRFIDGEQPAAADRFIWDDDLPGFGLRIKPSGAKSFLVQYRNKFSKSRRLTLGRYGVLTAEQARIRARVLLSEVARGNDPAQDRRENRASLTVAALCREYFDKAERGLILNSRSRKPKKASTLYTDRGRIDRHIIPLLGARAVKDVMPVDIRRFLQDVIAGKTKADVKTRARGRAIVRGGSGTATRTMGLLGGIFTYAQHEGYRSDNPVTGVVRPADGRRRVHVNAATYGQLGCAIREAENDGEQWQAVTAMRLLALTGCRRGEIERLQRSEIDLGAQALRLGDSKTGYSIRPIGAAAVKLLRETVRRSNGRYVLPGIRIVDKPYGGLPNAWRRRIAGKLDCALTPHGLRHAYASTGEHIGLTIPTIKALIGHSGGSVTEGYIHKPDAVLIAAADRLAAHIAGAMNKHTR